MDVHTHRKKILFTSSWFPSKSNGSLGNFVQRHAEAVMLKNDVHVLYVTAQADLKETFLLENSKENGIEITRVYFKPNRWWNPLRKMRAFQKGVKHLLAERHLRFDLVHHNVLWKDGWQPYLLNRKYKLPYIITEHWTGFDQQARGKASWSLQLLCRLFASRAAVICPVTENLAGNMKALGIKGKYRVVPNVVDTSLFGMHPKPLRPTRFLHVSSLDDKQKNISGILKVWKKVTEKDASLHLSIGGDGSWEPYQQLIEELNIPSSSITFFGEKSWSGIAELMKESHCLLMFSNYENLPCVIVEALASGMHIISTHVGGIAEHINETRGILIAPNDSNALESAILQYTHQFQDAPREALRDYAEKQFSIPSIAQAFDDIYNAVLNSND